MSRRVRVLGALVAVLAGVRGAVALLGPDYEPPAPVARFDVDAVARIVLAREDQELVLERDGEGGWLVASHGALPAREGVAGLLARIGRWRRERVAGSDPDTFAEWQVTEETARHLRLEDAQGEPLVHLLVGAITGIEPEDVRDEGYALDTEKLGLFVRPADEEVVYVVTDFVTRELEPDPRRWYLRPLVPVRPRDLRRLRLERPEGGFTLDAQALAFRDDPRPVDPRALGSLATTLHALEVLGPAPDGADPPADAPRYTLTPSGGEASAVTLWESEGATYARARGFRVEVTAPNVAEGTSTRREDLVRGRALYGDAARVRRLTLEGPEGARTVSRTDGGWTVGTGEEEAGASADAAAVRALLEDLFALEVRAWDPAAAELAETSGPGVHRLRVEDERGTGQELVLGRADGDGRRAARVGGVQLPCWLDASASADVLERIAALGR